MDEKELEDWLRGRPPHQAAEIAIRSAARVLPFLALLKEKPTLPFSFIPAFRAVLSAVVLMRFCDEASITATGLAADHAYRSVKSSVDHAEDRGACICIAARSAALAASYLALVKSPPRSLTTEAANAASHSALVFRGYDQALEAESAIWNEIENDIDTWRVSGTTMQAALWRDHSQTNFSEADAALATKIMRQTGNQDSFWLRWWEGAKTGHWLDWDLQREVALIPDEVWNGGIAALDEAISIIEARLQLRTDVSTLREALQQSNDVASSHASAAQRSHNNPPDLIEAQVVVLHDIATMVSALIDAEAALANTQPSPGILRRVAVVLLEGARSIVHYCAKLADIALKKAAEEVGSASAKWGIGLVGLNLAYHTEPIKAVAKALVDLASRLG